MQLRTYEKEAVAAKEGENLPRKTQKDPSLPPREQEVDPEHR